MSFNFKDTRQYHMGRRGEILTIGTLSVLCGLGLLDIAGTTVAKAPFFHRMEARIVAPDAMIFKTGPLGAEFKTKTGHNDWRGGSPYDEPRIGARTEEGIDTRSYLSYREFSRSTGLEVVLFVLSINEAELMGNTLSALGEPRQSPSSMWDMVNWDVRQFCPICSYDPAELKNYFRHKDGSWRDAPVDMPDEKSLRQMIDRLRPAQGEFQPLILDLMARLERGWRGAA